MKVEAGITAIVGFALVIATTLLAGPIGLVLLPVVLSELASVIWGRPEGGPSQPTMGVERQVEEGGMAIARETRSFAEVVEWAQAGDDFAWRLLIESQAPRVKSLARRIGDSLDLDASEIEQEVWILIFKRLGQLQNAEAFVAWSSRIVVNVAIGLDRARRKHIRAVNLEAELEPIVGPADDFYDLHQWLDGLEPHARLNFVLRAGHELSWESVTAEMVAHFPDRAWTVARCRYLFDKTLQLGRDRKTGEGA